MMVLQEAMREDPEIFEEAERVMDRIRSQRAAYNEEFERLIDNLINSPEDIERTLTIIDEMEELDRFPNDRVVEQVSEARVIAQLAFDRDRAATIMEEGLALLEDDEYASAVETYLSGFELQRERFLERDYGNVFENRTDDAVDEVRSSAQAFVSLAPRYRDSSTALVEAAQEDAVGPLPELVDEYTDVFEEIDERLSAVSEGVSILSEQAEEVRSMRPEDPVDWHIRLVRQLSAGRDNVEVLEGIAGAMQLAQSDSRSEVVEALSERTDVHLAQAAELLQQRLWDEGLGELRIAEEQAQAAVTLSAVGTEAAPDLPVTEATEVLSPELRALFADQHVRRETAVARGDLAETMDAVDARRVPLPVAAELPPLFASKVALAESVESLRQQVAEWRQQAEEYESLVPAVVSETVSSYVSETESALETRLDEVVEHETATLDRIADIRFSRLAQRFETQQGVYDEGVSRLDGVEEVVEQVDQTVGEELEDIEEAEAPEEEADEGEGDEADEVQEVTVVYRYPDEALERFLEAEEDLADLRGDVTSALESYRQEDEYVRADQRIQTRIEDTESLLAEVDELSEQVAGRITAARDQIARAEDLREEGDQFVSETRQAIDNLEIEEARETWQSARDSYFDSLELQQDAAFREEVDQLITDLGAEIQEARNRRIVQEVRQQIDEARTLYEQESYQDAYNILTEARESWAQTNVDPNPEIERLLGYVNAALNFEGTRSLTETEPLYPVLSSYLNVAKQDFSQARTMIDGNRVPEEADQLLARAEDNVDNVTAVRPFNWEARILKLRILRLRDSENFDEVFERRYEEAVEQKDTDPQEALTAFETLAAIDSDYPGIEDQIVELEIELGIRPDPVTEAQIAEANRLYQQAQNTISGGGEAQRRAAISMLEEAVTLDPENSDAQTLLDRLRIESGGQATATLNSAEEQQFRRAEELFIEDNLAQAYAIVQQLLQDEKNQSYPPLVDLEERIASRLGL
ncbi:MAG: hypothetical protein ACQETQ_06005 [Spirochaetota bacterium]